MSCCTLQEAQNALLVEFMQNVGLIAVPSGSYT